jgi:hypothetical protein
VSDNQRLEVDAFVRYHMPIRCCFINRSQHARRLTRSPGGMQLGAAPRRIGGLDHRYRTRQARRADG